MSMLPSVQKLHPYADVIKRLYVDELYNVRQTREELERLNVVTTSQSTLIRFLINMKWYREVNPHPRNEKKRREIVANRELIEHLYVDEKMSFERVKYEMRERGFKFGVSMLRGYLIEWGVGRSLSESDAIRTLEPRGCQSCDNEFKPKSSQHQCCDVCSPPGWGYWTKHKITPAMYDAMLKKQHGLCALCPRMLCDLPSKAIHLDHCHKTNIVRGILCSRCNHCIHVIECYPGWGEKAEKYVKGSL
jgi:hypothetical protein